MFTFNAQEFQPAYGISESLPVGKYKGIIVGSKMKPTKDNLGMYVQVEVQVLDGDHANKKIFDNLNLLNSSQQAVAIANQQLSAYCHVVGVFQVQQVGEECLPQLHNRPFMFEVGLQKNDPARTEIKAIFDINGNKPSKAGAGATSQQASAPPPQQPMQGVEPAGNIGAWGNPPQPSAPPPQAQAPAGWGQR